MNPEAARIEVFEPAHIPEARSLWGRSEGVGLSEADEPEALAAYLARNPAMSFVATHEGRIVGTVLCGHDGRRGLVHHLVVSPECRRHGLGRLLLRRGLSALRAAGIGKAHLLVFRTNAAGLAFWRSVGAEERTALALFSVGTANAV